MDVWIVVGMMNHILMPKATDPTRGITLEHLMDLAAAKRWRDGMQMFEIREIVQTTASATSAAYKK